METNLKAAYKLLEKYKSITIKELEQTAKDYQIDYNETFGSELLSNITNFNTDNCWLCEPLNHLKNKEKCKHCIYYNINPVIYTEDTPYELPCLTESFDKIEYAQDEEELYDAIQERIKFLEKAIKVTEEKYGKDN